MTHDRRHRHNPLIYQQACEWFVEFRTDEPGEAQRRAFHEWLKESPAHVAAYLDVASSWNRAGSAAVAQEYPKDILIAEAAAAAAEVVSFQPASIATQAVASDETSSIARHRWSARPVTRIAIAASLAALVMVALSMVWMGGSTKTYSTGIGEFRSIVLRDGSKLNLNARSRARVRFTERERSVDLLEGQALFSVAKDPARPFVVYSGATQVRAVGTEFDVYRKAAGSVVTVIEGRVAVVATPDERSARARSNGSALPVLPEPSFVSAGERLTVLSDAAPQLEILDVENAVTWPQGRMVFEATPLKEVAEEFNRYNERQIVIEDASLERFEIDGVFSSTDVTGLVQFFRQRPDLQITETESQIIVRSQPRAQRN